MSKRIITIITAAVMVAAVFTACTDKEPAETSEQAAQETTVETTAEQTEATDITVETVAETAAETQNSDGIPQPGDTYNGHTVDHTEDQPDCDDASHGTVWIFYTDCEDIDYIIY